MAGRRINRLSATANGVPVATIFDEPTISITDFAVPERRLASHIDGAAFHLGQRLRRDRFIRDKLRNGDPPWRVEELRAADLGQGRAMADRIQGRYGPFGKNCNTAKPQVAMDDLISRIGTLQVYWDER